MWRVEVEESCRLTRSKLLSISPTICTHHHKGKIPGSLSEIPSGVRRWSRARSKSMQSREEEELTVLRPLALESMAGMDGSGGGRGSNERCPEKMMICKLYW